MDIDYCICYYSEQNAKGIALNLLSFGYEHFVRAVHVEKINELEKFVNHSDFTKPGFFIENVRQFAFDNLLDAIKISICFENYMKAKLILDGYVIHRIAGGQKNKKLRKDQKTRPIKVNEVNDIETWKKIDNQERYYLPGLSENTIQFSTMLNKEKYQNVIGLSNEIRDIIVKINNQRNSLHFLTDEFGNYGKERVEKLRQIIDFVEKDLFTLQNQLVYDLKLPDDKKLKKRQLYRA